MKTMNWLIRREFWEHKGMLFWAPLIVGAAMIAFLGSVILYGGVSGEIADKVVIRGDDGHTVSQIVEAMTPEKKASVSKIMAAGYMMVSAPLFLMMAVVLFFYCLGAMYDERRDRSILFWKSLPVSDGKTVLSKVVTALCLAPLITIAAAIVTSLVLMLILGTVLAVNGVNLFGHLLSDPALYLTPLRVLALLPIFALWALPTVGWLLMVSSWARSKVFLWAVGAPILSILVLKWADHLYGLQWNLDWFAQNVIARGLTSLFPGSWLAASRFDQADLAVIKGTEMVDPGSLLTHSWSILAGPNVWIGAAAGAAMIFVAVRVRRYREEG